MSTTTRSRFSLRSFALAAFAIGAIALTTLGPVSTAPAHAASTTLTDGQRASIVAAARSLIGTQYGSDTGWGHNKNAAGPTDINSTASMSNKPVVAVGSSNAATDCSGLTRYAYAALGLDIEWTGGINGSGTFSAGTSAQPALFDQIDAASALPGDLMWKPGHVAIVSGGGKIVEALSPGKKASEDSIPSGATFYRLKATFVALAKGGSTTTPPTPPTTTQLPIAASGNWWGAAHWTRLGKAIGLASVSDAFGRSPWDELNGAYSASSKSLQNYLNAQDGGLTANITADGYWGPTTTEKLRAVIDRKCGLTKLGIYGAIDGKGANSTTFQFNQDEAAALAKCLNSNKF